jgi:hypothetical protein
MFTFTQVAGRLAVVLAAAGTLSALPPAAAAAPATYTHTQTIPVPPASNYSGTGGGDGWGISLSSTSVYNVFHHSSGTTLACHRQTDASQCWPAKTIVDADGHGFSSGAQSGTFLQQASGKLYSVGRRSFDQTTGVVCIDTVAAEGAGSPFCGFTPLTPVGAAPLPAFSAPVIVGQRLYAFNPQNVTGDANGANRMLCVDLATQTPCAGQPFSLGITGAVTTSAFPAPAATLIGGRIFVPLRVAGTTALQCFDPATGAACGGAWPQPIPTISAENVGAAFPVLNAAGTPTGLCLPEGPGSPCFTLAGAPLVVAPALNAAIPTTSGWNGPAVVIGPRVYIASNEGAAGDRITCWDFLADKACDNFPKKPVGAGYVYTVNADPQRPDCLWLNADYGAAQIQNFDAYSGAACGVGAIRVLASSFIAPAAKCAPTSYLALRLVDPARAAYTDGSVTIADGSGQALPGASALTIDAAGAVDLRSLAIDPAIGLPQFVIALTGASAQQQAVTVELSWRADYDATCDAPGTIAKPDPAPTASPAPTLTPAPATPTVAPTPAPAQGAVLGARAAPKLTGSARFAAHTLRVGQTTTLTVSVRNSGDAASTAGEVCVRVASSLVILRVPAGVTMKGSVLCAKRTATAAGASTTAAKGIVVRAVTAAARATVTDGKNDGVTLSGDALRALRAQSTRGGGVTG